MWLLLLTCTISCGCWCDVHQLPCKSFTDQIAPKQAVTRSQTTWTPIKSTYLLPSQPTAQGPKVSAKSQATREKSTQNCPTHSAPPEVVRMHWHVLLDAYKIFPSSLEQSNQNHSMLQRLQTWSVKNAYLIWSVVMEHSTRICWANMIDLVYHPARYFPPPTLQPGRCPTMSHQSRHALRAKQKWINQRFMRIHCCCNGL